MGYDWQIINKWKGETLSSVEIIHKCKDHLVLGDNKGIKIIKDSLNYFTIYTIYANRSDRRMNFIQFNPLALCPDCQEKIPDTIWFQIGLLLG